MSNVSHKLSVSISGLDIAAVLPYNQRNQCAHFVRRTFDPAANLLPQIVSHVKRRCCGRYRAGQENL